MRKSLWLLGLVCFIALLQLTRYHLDFRQAIDWVQATDVSSYSLIANYAFDTPVKLEFHFAQRWVPHYIVGVLARTIGCDIHLSYAILNALVISLIAYSAKRLLISDRANNDLGFLILLLFLFSAYTFRLYVFVPGLFADLVYLLGVAIALLGCRRQKIFLVIIGLVVATLGKQFSILVLPGILVYIFAVWGKSQGRIGAIKLSMLAIGAVLGTLWLVTLTSESFSLENSITPDKWFAIITFFTSENFTARLLGFHLLRIAAPLAPFLLIWVLLPMSRRERFRYLLSWESLALLLIVLGPITYAFLPGPILQMGNQSRYVAASALPLALLVVRISPPITVTLRVFDWIVIPIVLLLISYHHRYTLIQGDTAAFATTQFTGLAILGVWAIWHRRRLSLVRAREL